jgi:hypothetical protein
MRKLVCCLLSSTLGLATVAEAGILRHIKGGNQHFDKGNIVGYMLSRTIDARGNVVTVIVSGQSGSCVIAFSDERAALDFVQLLAVQKPDVVVCYSDSAGANVSSIQSTNYAVQLTPH